MTWVEHIRAHKVTVRAGRNFDYGRLKKTMRYKPGMIHTMADLKREMLKILGEKAHIFSDYKNRKFFSFGSCFATNISAYLSHVGAQSNTTTLTEDVNSPINNVFMLKRILLGTKSSVTDDYGKDILMEYDSLAKQLREATDIIVTLGNIFYLTLDGVNVIAHSAGAVLNEQTPWGTEYCIREILGLLHTHTSARIFLTVSPVPISGYRGDKYASAIEADCASKSQLRAALSELKGFTYLPLFEVFKWLPPHQSFLTFAVDDGSARHIALSHIEMVMEALT